MRRTTDAREGRGARLATPLVLLAAGALALLLACDRGESQQPAGGAAGEAPAAQPAPAAGGGAGATAAGAPGAAAVQEAEQIFATRCATCHGATGAGDGPGSAALSPKPRDFRDAVWQDSVTDEHIAQILQYGGAAVGKSPSMPGNPDLISKPEVVAALVQHVRSLRSP